MEIKTFTQIEIDKYITATVTDNLVELAKTDGNSESVWGANRKTVVFTFGEIQSIVNALQTYKLTTGGPVKCQRKRKGA